MLTPLLTDKELITLMRLIQEARRIVVCGHRSPDGDALGSTIGWTLYLRSLRKTANIVMPNPFPDFLRTVPGAGMTVLYDRQPDTAQRYIREADLIFCLDFNALSRLENMGETIARSQAKKVIIDHHLDPDTSFAALTISHPERSSTSELVFRLIDQLGGFDAMTSDAAAALYTGMMTDTGGFTYNSNDPEIYLIISRLLTKGIDKDKIYRNVFNNYTESRLRLMGYVLYERLRFLAGGRATLFTLTREDMARFNYIRGDAEGFVNLPLQVRGTRLSISLREDTETDIIRVSLRSVDDFPCNRMAAEFFNGGGHLNASGGRLPWPLEEAVRTVEQAVEAYLPLLEKSEGQCASHAAPARGNR